MQRTLFLLLFTLPAIGASAQDAPSAGVILPETVVTATRVPTLADQIAAGVTVIDHQTIEERGYTTLVDAFTSVPGLHIAQSGGPGGNASVFIRGTNSNQVLVLRDGVPVNDPSDPNGAFNFGVDTLADVDRIEVVRGPMSSLWGSAAVGGVINIITRTGSGPAHGTVTGAAGAPLQGLAGATLAGSSGRFDYNLAAQSYNTIGFDTTPQRESVFTGARNHFNSQTAAINLGFTPVDGTRFFASLRYRGSLFNLDELGFPAYDARDYVGRDTAWNGSVGVTSKLFGGVWETGLTVSQLNTYRSYSEPLEAADPNVAVGYSRYNGRRTAVEWINTVHLGDWGPARATALTVNGMFRQDGSSSYVNESISGFPYQSSIVARDRYGSGSVGLQSTLFQRLTVTAGVREEGATYGGNAFTWRLGAVLALPEAWSRLKASYGTAFLAPSLYDLFGVDSDGYVGNPNLKAERSQGGEVGWAIDIPALGRRDAATIDVTYFANHISDLIQFVEAPDFLSSTEENVASARTSGVEASVTLRPIDWLEGVLSYTNTRATGTGGAPLLRRPRNQASANLRLTPLPGLTIAPEVLYVSGAYDYLVDDFGFPAGIGLTKRGVIFNMTVNYAVTPTLTLFVDARNLSGSRYEPASGFQMPGPSFLAGARLRY